MWNFTPRQKRFFVLIAAKVHTRAEVRNPFICQRGFSVLFFLYSATLSYMWLVFLFSCLFLLYWNNFITNNDCACVYRFPQKSLSLTLCVLRFVNRSGSVFMMTEPLQYQTSENHRKSRSSYKINMRKRDGMSVS